MKKFIMAIFSMMLITVLAACGGGEEASSDKGGSGDGGTVTLEATNYEFDKEVYKVAAGEVTIDLKSSEGYHGITVEGTDIKIDGEGSASANFKPGEYKIICSIPCGEGHHEMTAMLVVE
ncbi:cytochrome C oxidase subunit II [Pseudalkalibacillus sp. R45]|uniref:cytochrome C oxidase subunit II n=1 Tax=Pseudalkalibacillus sp. R45 TaxID=3457433 RepID=UPI003FCD78C2